MHAKPFLSISFAALVTGCAAPIAEGQIAICSSALPEIEESGVVLSGVVAALNDGTVDCTQSITITGQAEDDAVVTVGYTLLDADGVDITPALDLAVDDSISGVYRNTLVWGTVEALVLEDSAGLVLAADQGGPWRIAAAGGHGTWGGGLEEGDVGFSVSLGEEVIASEESECQTKDGYAVVFEADESVSVEPVGSAAIEVDGQALTAHALAAFHRGPGKRCEVSDQTDYLSWAVVR